MPAVPFHATEELTDEKQRETTGALTIITTESFATTFSKPEAIVRPLRRREPSDDDNRSPDLQDLEAQIIEKLSKFDKSKAPQKEHIRDIEKRNSLQYQRWNQSRDSKKSSRDVSDLCLVSCGFVTL